MEKLAERLGIDNSLLDLWCQLDGDTQAATALVVLCSAGCDSRLRQKYAIKWWSEFLPERVTLCARIAGSLADFTAQLSGRLQGQIGAWQNGEAHRALWQEMIALSEVRQRKILDILETQAVVCTTLVRADLDAKRERRGEHGTTTSSNGGERGSASQHGPANGGPGLFDGAGGAAGAVEESDLAVADVSGGAGAADEDPAL